MTNYRIVLRYDGRNYFGWQRHGSRPTIQRALEEALKNVVEAPCVVYGSGRTDRGAHAEGQVASVDLPGAQDPASLLERVNGALPGDIRVTSFDLAADDFHARASASGKAYRYEIWNAAACPDERLGRVWHVPEPLDAEAMAAAGAILVGEHDFASFATRPNFQQKSTHRHLRSASLTHAHPRISMSFVADGFLYRMVRNMVRAIVKVGEGRWDADDLAHALRACDRRASPGTAPASGLYLDEVFYPDG